MCVLSSKGRLHNSFLWFEQKIIVSKFHINKLIVLLAREANLLVFLEVHH